jgi:hypothetical protein
VIGRSLLLNTLGRFTGWISTAFFVTAFSLSSSPAAAQDGKVWLCDDGGFKAECSQPLPGNYQTHIRYFLLNDYTRPGIIYTIPTFGLADERLRAYMTDAFPKTLAFWGGHGAAFHHP